MPFGIRKSDVMTAALAKENWLTSAYIGGHDSRALPWDPVFLVAQLERQFVQFDINSDKRAE